MKPDSKRFVLDPSLQVVLSDLGISSQDLLRHARLPMDLFSQESPTLSTEEYFRIWHGMTQLSSDPTFPLRLAQSISVEAFSPPVFACLCSPNLNIALKRLSEYKPLVGPLRLEVSQNDIQTVIGVGGLPHHSPPPASLMATETVFMTQLARLATRERIVPLAVHMLEMPAQPESYADYFGVDIREGLFNGVVFSAEDAERPFLTANDKMWAIFEPELRTRMKDLGIEAGFRERVRACLMEILASGQFSIVDVAEQLAVSTRTLQRRLRQENTSFQRELNELREQLARHYLMNSRYSNTEISFLLGYEDPNSFIRAFHGWTGQTPEAARSAALAR